MKFEVIGWTDYDNPGYPPHRGDGGAVGRAVIEEIRKKGYRFGGDYHQDGAAGAPVLNDGTIVRYSMRTWGGVMADALGETGDMTYMSWYMNNVEALAGGKPRKIITPRGDVDVLRIRPREELKETFRMHLDAAAFEAVASGKKSVELRLNDKDRHYICKDDIIVFENSDGGSVKVQVTDVHYFDTFGELFEEEADPLFRDEEEEKRKKALVERAFFAGYDTPKKLLDFLNAIYSRERQEQYYAMAIQMRRIEQ